MEKNMNKQIIKSFIALALLATAANAQASSSEPTQFGDKVRGTAYNSVSNAVASDNINDYLARPDLFYNQKLFYIEPAGEMGVASLGNLFFALDLSQDLGRGTIGYAVKGFGISARASLGQFAVTGDNEGISGTEAGNDFGVAVSKVLGNYALTLSADYITQAKETNVEPSAGKSTSEKHNDLTINIGVSNAPSAKNNGWNTGLNFVLHNDKMKSGGKVVDSTENSYTRIAPYFNFGRKALANQRARLLLGTNVSIPVVLFDGDSTMFGVNLSPNILGEVAVTEGFTVFGEVSYDWLVFSFVSGTATDDTDYTALASHSGAVNATAGLRYAKDWFALELSFGDTFFTDTKAFFNSEGVFVSFGGFIYF